MAIPKKSRIRCIHRFLYYHGSTTTTQGHGNYEYFTKCINTYSILLLPLIIVHRMQSADYTSLLLSLQGLLGYSHISAMNVLSQPLENHKTAILLHAWHGHGNFF